MEKFGLLVLVATVACVYASKPETCTLDGVTFKAGEYFERIGKCQLVKCTGSQVLISSVCPIDQPAAGCTFIREDPKKPYPECCPQIKC
ncbi:venom peptide Pc-like [Musca domestica]|uniref:Venom peptide Pc-like n=1 Tax=Musca domestica TaxID=7370 RepID=A0ABM3UYB3_MUSDO|nr:venom peptide Pc-like [Musca domestica]